jgi:pyruvate dehydrogenase E1 component alpha subunit
MKRRAAYGIPAEQVDGNDAVAVYTAAGRAVARARAGEGPTLLECLTYRQCGHSRSDPRTYRSREEEQEWAKLDPIVRLAERLLAANLATEASLETLKQGVIANIDEAVAFAEASPTPEPADALKHVFSEEGS